MTSLNNSIKGRKKLTKLEKRSVNKRPRRDKKWRSSNYPVTEVKANIQIFMNFLRRLR